VFEEKRGTGCPLTPHRMRKKKADGEKKGRGACALRGWKEGKLPQKDQQPHSVLSAPVGTLAGYKVKLAKFLKERNS